MFLKLLLCSDLARFSLAVLFSVLLIQCANANCADLNRQAIPNKEAFAAAAAEYKASALAGLRDTQKDSAPIDVIAQGVASSTKMITAMDKLINHLQAVQRAGCFGKDAKSWAGAIAKMEAQRDDLRRDRSNSIKILSIMADAEIKSQK